MTTATKSAFDRIEGAYGTGPSAGVPGQPWGRPPMGAPDRFQASRAFDKLIFLSTLTLISGVAGYLIVPVGIAFGCMAVAFGLVLVSWFRMGWAKVLAPVYSVLEGIALGAVSAEYATLGHGIVPTAIVFTGAVFAATLVLYRTGLVRVTPRMLSLAFMGALGLMAVGLLSLLGLSVPGVNSFGTFGLIFGVVGLAIAVLNLFADFEYITQAEARQISADAEWASALAMMTALVLVYISILRLLGSAYGGGGRRR